MPKLSVFPKCYMDELAVDKTMSLFDWIDQAVDLDVDGLEMYTGFFADTTDEYIGRVRSACQEAGLAAPMMCFSPDFTKPSLAERKKELERQKRAIDLTASLGGEVCRTLTGQNRPGLDPATTIVWCAEMIREAAEYAGSRGITLAIENHYKDNYWDYPEFALKSDVFLQVIARVDSPHFGVNFDPSNAIVAGEEPIELLDKIKGRVVSMHASDRYLEGGSSEDLRRMEANPVHGYAHMIKHGVIGKGLNDYDTIFSILSGIGFDGWVSIEDGVNGMEELRESVRYLRAKLAEYFQG